jgi:hypothetical protein
MIVELVGYLLCAAGRVRGGDAGQDLDRVGRELVRLGRRPRHPAATSA